MHTFKPNDLAMILRIDGHDYKRILPGDIVTIKSVILPVGAIYQLGDFQYRIVEPSYEIRGLSKVQALAYARGLKPLPSREEIEENEYKLFI